MPKPPYEPRTPPTILIKALMDLIAQAKKKGAGLTMGMAFLDNMVDLEELDNSPRFQELAEGLRARWNALVEEDARQRWVERMLLASLPLPPLELSPAEKASSPPLVRPEESHRESAMGNLVGGDRGQVETPPALPVGAEKPLALPEENILTRAAREAEELAQRQSQKPPQPIAKRTWWRRLKR